MSNSSVRSVFTGGYEPAGVVHRGEYILPMYKYPRWVKRIKPAFLRGFIGRPFRKKNPALKLFTSLVESSKP